MFVKVAANYGLNILFGLNPIQLPLQFSIVDTESKGSVERGDGSWKNSISPRKMGLLLNVS